ncbi:MAG TPA: SpoIIE family protein phosphatase [bacterium]|nr:SpoIIE family protein phosphatase [bacterium]
MGEAVEGPKGLSIRLKLAAVIAGLVILSLGLLSYLVLQEASDALLQEATRRGLVIGRNLADYSASAVLQKDPLMAAQFTSDAMKDDAMVHSVLVDEQGIVMALRTLNDKDKEQLPAPGQPWVPLQGAAVELDGLPANVEVVQSLDPVSGMPVLAMSFPVIKADVRVGTAYIALSEEKIRAVVEETRLRVLLLALVFVVVALAIALGLSNVIVRPIQRLTSGALAVGRGHWDVQVAVTSKDELGVLAKSFNAMSAGLKKAQTEMLATAALKQELNIAQEIQQGLLPKKIPQVPGYEIAAFYAPAKEVGGDLYDFIRIEDQRLALVVADVSGKSVPGSLGMTMARSVLRAQALSRQGVAETLHKTNEVIQPDIRRGMFVTMFYAVLDMASHRITCANAGHNPCFKLLANGTVEEIGPEGIALGLVPAHQFYVDEMSFELAPGETLVFYTDGVTEAMNAASEEYGEERFQASMTRTVGRSAADMLPALVADVRAFVAGAPPHDDITLVLLRRLPL